MIQKISEHIEVGMSKEPKWVKWREKIYKIEKVGLHHSFRQGRTLYHAYSVVTKTLFLRITLDTDTLNWKLEEISDGLPS